MFKKKNLILILFLIRPSVQIWPDLGWQLKPNNTAESQRDSTYTALQALAQITSFLGPGYLDNEEHFLLSCQTFSLKRNCFLATLCNVLPHFNSLSNYKKIVTILCPTTTIASKLCNKYIKILFNARKLIDGGEPVQYHGYEGGVVQNELFEDLDTSENLD